MSNTSSTETNDQLNERNNQTLNDIKTLQTNEMDLYSRLNNDKLTPEQKEQLMNQINQISQMRLSLYSTIKTMYDSAIQNASQSSNTMNQQMTAIKVIEDELNESKKKLNMIESQKNNKLRLVQINTYYGKQYDAYKSIMQIVVFTCIPIIILSILGNKGIIPDIVNTILVSIIIVIGSVLIGYLMIDLYNRDNMNFDEYNLYFNKSDAPSNSTTTDSSSSSDPWATTVKTCIGNECCDPSLSVYDPITNKCIPIKSTTTTSTTTEEAMISGHLSKYAFDVKAPVVSLCNKTNPKPSNSSELSLYARI